MFASSSGPSQDGFRRLNCLIKSESIVFLVTVGRDCVVGELKKAIKEKRALDTLKNVDPHVLELWKPNDSNPITAKPADTLVERIKSSGLSDQLDPTDPIFSIFPNQPPGGNVHVIVKVPDTDIRGKRATPPPADVDYLKSVVVVPIVGELFLHHLVLEVRPWVPIAAVHNRTRDELKSIYLIGEFFRAHLEILPLATTPTMIELREHNLAELRANVHRKPEDFPPISFDEFFNRFYVKGQQDLCVHFLVWLPPQHQRFPEDPTPTIFWFINSNLNARLSFEDATVASQSRADTQANFKRLLKREYHQPEIGNLFDMATGTCLPHSIVVASYIFQYMWRKELPEFTSLTDINDPCNGLLLYKPVEWAFDRAKICVEVKSRDEMTFRLLDQDLRGILLADKACHLRDQRGGGNQRLKEEENLRMTFGDLDGQPLKFPEGTVMRPSKRMLGLHAVRARGTAQVRVPQHPIPEVAYDTSDDETTKKAITILQWRQGVEHGGPFD